MRHFSLMVLFAAIVAVTFGVIGRNNPRAQALYGLKIFFEFVGVGLVLAWLLYWLP